MSDEFYSFEEVKKILGLSKAELLEKIALGKISARRNGHKTLPKFRKSVIDKIKKITLEPIHDDVFNDSGEHL